MLKKTEEFLIDNYNISERTFEIYRQALKDTAEQFEDYDEIREYNQLKVLKAFQTEKISDAHFTNTTGYGLDDIGRDSLDKVYANIFKTEAGLVRPHFVSGTHAIGCAIAGNVRPGDKILCVSGLPYDTLLGVLGLSKKKNSGSLDEFGIKTDIVDLDSNGKFQFEKIKEAIKADSSIKLIHIQRSTGYAARKSFLVSEIAEVIRHIKEVRNDVSIFVDNCYGEFIEIVEPTEFGADIMAGSLMKNIGGGIAPGGGYIVGKKNLVDAAANRLTVPGVGGEYGATYGLMRSFYQGLFSAPHVSIEAVKTAIFCARVMEIAGFKVFPPSSDKRTDIIQAIEFGNSKKLVNFCSGIQAGSPIDAFAVCEPWAMPGYDSEIVMAAGAFISGSTIELSADGPVREPYIAYIQGGLNFDHGKIGVLIGLSKVLEVE
ncbi:aminotransferase class I/II-fold pyridoxal phosphate-dependent enzyme [Clostridium chromiireducens]|uniref:Methionine gamma-lyase n=1 Tax=Clostridium chromiireducens TaxID=225345 RepID=A0A1V4I9E3_9CLOT|nr:methionine gamma-lyase family protein [Clostridium chromiireducens]OPJ56533.1 methionine gamma-lyase [Clostridium chromiireducens]